MERNNGFTCSEGCNLRIFLYKYKSCYVYFFLYSDNIFEALIFPFETIWIAYNICSKHNYCYILYFPSPMHLLSISFSLFNHSIKILQFRIFGILPIFWLSSVLPLYSVFKMYTKCIPFVYRVFDFIIWFLIKICELIKSSHWKHSYKPLSDIAPTMAQFMHLLRAKWNEHNQ